MIAHILAAALLLSSSAFAAAPAPAQPAPENTASGVILYEAVSGTVLYERNADSRHLIASVTKIMTALVVLERAQPEAQVCVKAEWTGVEGSGMGLTAGETLTVRDLLYGLLLTSGNDAARALACYCAGSEADFAQLMNKKAEELGMSSSHFENPHGLDAAEHYSTARDLVRLAAAAMRNATFAEIVAMKSAAAAGRTLVNHNKLLTMYPGAVGIKTGYTDAAGRTLVSCADVDGMRLICVTLNDPDDWNDHMELFDWARACYKLVKPVETGKVLLSVPVISGTAREVGLAGLRDCALLIPADSQVRLDFKAPRFVYAHVAAGETAGSVSVMIDGAEKDNVPLVYAESVAVDPAIPLDRWERLKWAWYFANRHSTCVRNYYLMQ